MGGDDFGGALWLVAVFDSALFIAFGAAFFRPRSRRDWRAMGAYSAFVVALFSEMYGFPLTIFILSGWLGDTLPAIVPTHAGGHLLNDLVGWSGDPHLSPFHVASYVLMGAGFLVLARAWPVLWRAQRTGELAVRGPYARVRHPQYSGFMLVMIAFLLQWPTLVTLLMFPVLVVAYRRLAKGEEREVERQFGAAYADYASVTPRFVPRLRRPRASAVAR